MNALYKKLRKVGFLGTLLYLFSKLWNAIVTKNLVRIGKKNQKIVENRMIFVSNPDYADNGRALSDFLTSHRYNDKYEIVWIVENPREYKRFQQKNVRFVREKLHFSNNRTAVSQLLVYHAKYIIYTHSVRWTEKRDGQLWLNLWHGCGYKSAKGDSDFIQFDYALVPGEVFRDTKAEFFNCEREKFLPIGYPRYDVMLGNDENGKQFFSKLLPGYKKAVMWMPTYRKSIRSYLNEDTLVSPFDIPLMYCRKDWMNLDTFCRKRGILLVVKRHYLQKIYTMDRIRFTNVFFIDDDTLKNADVQLYEVLGATDALITDYSSVAIDFMLMNRPIGFTLDDFDGYKNSRGFVFDDPLEFMPGHHMFSYEDMESFLQDVADEKDLYEQKRLTVMPKVHNRTEQYCQRIADTLQW